VGFVFFVGLWVVLFWGVGGGGVGWGGGGGVLSWGGVWGWGGGGCFFLGGGGVWGGGGGVFLLGGGGGGGSDAHPPSRAKAYGKALVDGSRSKAKGGPRTQACQLP